MDNQIIEEEIIKLKNRIKELIGNKKLDNGFLIKDYDKFKLFKYHEKEYIDYYGKDDSFDNYNHNIKSKKHIEYHICKRCNKKMTIKDYDYMIDMAFENGGCSCACCMKTCGE